MRGGGLVVAFVFGLFVSVLLGPFSGRVSVLALGLLVLAFGASWFAHECGY